jgi:hypothetical protein
MWRATSYLLVAAVVLLAALLVAPWPALPVREPVAAPARENVVAPAQQREGPILAVPPERIAALFGWRAPVARQSRPEVVPKAEPAEASWITYVGYVLKEDGVRYYVFKDSRSGQVHTLSVGQSSSGWILKAVTPGGFVLEFQDAEYIIKADRATR